MADPLPRPGSILLGNTAQVAVDTSGYVVLHDPDYLLLETGTTDAMLLETGTTDGLLLEPYDCACCVEGLCGECAAPIVGDITLDLTAAGFNGANDYYCDSQCEALNAVIVLTQTNDCKWEYYVEPFCTFINNNGIPSWLTTGESRFFFDLSIGFYDGAWQWKLLFRYQYKFAFIIGAGIPPTYASFLMVTYHAATTTSCSGVVSLTKVSEIYPFQIGWVLERDPNAGLACEAGDGWVWPDTLSITVP